MHHAIKSIYASMKHKRPKGSEVPIPDYLAKTVSRYYKALDEIDRDNTELAFVKALLQALIEEKKYGHKS